MATVTQQKIRGRPAYIAGPTFLAYTPNGRKLVTAGASNFMRVFETGSDGEPINIDDCQENNTAVAATNDLFLSGSEDGTVCIYSLETSQYEKMPIRCTLPIRDIAISPDGQWAAVASDELAVKIFDIEDPNRILHLRDCPKPAKHLSYHPSGSYIAVSCTDGVVYIYSVSTEEPELIKKIPGFIRTLETDSEVSSKVIWHPDGRAFAVPTVSRDIQVVSRSDWEKQKVFSSGHAGEITALAWSPNGALLVSAAKDGKIVLWDVKTQKVLARYEYPNVLNIVWHPVKNLASFTTSNGEVFIYEDFVPAEFASLLEEALHPAPLLHDTLKETSGNSRKPLLNGEKSVPVRRRRGSVDTLDDILGSDLDPDEDDFVVDDDGAGYALNGNGKRTNEFLDNIDGTDAKRRPGYSAWRPRIHESFQPGSTPWRGNRRYFCLNLTGFVWTVDQDSHHTVTVEFYDREMHRDFHFTDPYLYDKACLNDTGTLFSCPPANGNPAMVYYRPHETWTARADWRTKLPPGEDVTSIALSDSFIVITTSTNYVRVYTLFGTPFRVYRQKSSPTVTCAAWRDYILTMGNGPIGGDGAPKLLYTIENIRRDEVCQSEDTVALADGTELKSVFFSDNGDPCIYDSEGVLLILQHWRTPGQARWVPLLDTKLLERLASGKKEESYWPVAVAQDKFHCIILKGGDQNPYFPRPLLSEFDFQIPISTLEKPKASTDDDEDEVTAREGPRLEESFVRTSLMVSLLEDLVSATNSTHGQRAELARKEVEVDKALLQLLNVECRQGEETGMKALRIVSLMKDKSGKMLEAAAKIAQRYNRTLLEDKIRELADTRMMGMDEEDDS